MKELFDIIYIQKRLYLYNNKYYIRDIDLSNLFSTNINDIIKKDKLLKYLCIKINGNYYFDNECVIYVVNLLNTNRILTIYNKILTAFDLILKYNSLFKISI